MSTGDKVIILAQVENKSKGKRQALMALGIPKSSYYRWRRCDDLEETGEGRGTGSLRKKKARYWR